jgi:hypothetical protein
MNRSCVVGSGASKSAVDAQDDKVAPMTRGIHVLFVGPVEFGSVVHDALVDGMDFRLSIAPNYRELWVIPRNESIQLIILHSTLSPSELEQATRLVRKQWPDTRILLIRTSEGSLDDPLYDDRVVPTASSEVLFRRIEGLTRESHEWRAGDIEP